MGMGEAELVPRWLAQTMRMLRPPGRIPSIGGEEEEEESMSLCIVCLHIGQKCCIGRRKNEDCRGT